MACCEKFLNIIALGKCEVHYTTRGSMSLYCSHEQLCWHHDLGHPKSICAKLFQIGPVVSGKISFFFYFSPH